MSRRYRLVYGRDSASGSGTSIRMASIWGVSLALRIPQSRSKTATRAREIFRQCIAEAHVDAALNLSSAGFRIDCAADVVSRHDTFDAAVVTEDHDLGRVTEGHVRSRLRQCCRSAAASGEVADVVAGILAAGVLFEL